MFCFFRVFLTLTIKFWSLLLKTLRHLTWCFGCMLRDERREHQHQPHHLHHSLLLPADWDFLLNTPRKELSWSFSISIQLHHLSFMFRLQLVPVVRFVSAGRGVTVSSSLIHLSIKSMQTDFTHVTPVTFYDLKGPLKGQRSTEFTTGLNRLTVWTVLDLNNDFNRVRDFACLTFSTTYIWVWKHSLIVRS